VSRFSQLVESPFADHRAAAQEDEPSGCARRVAELVFDREQQREARGRASPRGAPSRPGLPQVEPVECRRRSSKGWGEKREREMHPFRCPFERAPRSDGSGTRPRRAPDERVRGDLARSAVLRGEEIGQRRDALRRPGRIPSARIKSTRLPFRGWEPPSHRSRTAPPSAGRVPDTREESSIEEQLAPQTKHEDLPTANYEETSRAAQTAAKSFERPRTGEDIWVRKGRGVARAADTLRIHEGETFHQRGAD